VARRREAVEDGGGRLTRGPPDLGDGSVGLKAAGWAHRWAGGSRANGLKLDAAVVLSSGEAAVPLWPDHRTAGACVPGAMVDAQEPTASRPRLDRPKPSVGDGPRTERRRAPHR